jgi:hypothetical protein
LARLSIPERYRDGIAALAALPEASFSDLLRVLEEKPLADTVEEMGSQLETRLPSIPDLVTIIDTIVSVQGLDIRSHVPSRTLAADLWEALLTDSPKLAENLDGETLKSRVLEVVKAPHVQITSEKIKELQVDVEKSFCGVRILTDVRTAFSDDATELPRGMTLLHSLQIAYHDDTGRHREFYVTLDSGDLVKIKEAIERAEKKKSTLEGLLAKANCRLFE